MIITNWQPLSRVLKNIHLLHRKMREAVMKGTSLDLKDLAGAIVLKDKFMAQSAPHVRRTLQKLGMGPIPPRKRC